MKELEIKQKIRCERLNAEGMPRMKELEALTTICKYCEFIALYTAEIIVTDIVKELRGNKELCTFKGYVQEVKAVEAAMNNVHTKTVIVQGKMRPRVQIICTEQYEYMTKTLEQIRMSVCNWGYRMKGNNPRLMSAVTTAQSVVYWAASSLKVRNDEIKREYDKYIAEMYDDGTGKKQQMNMNMAWDLGKFRTLEDLAFKLNDALIKLVDKCCVLIGDSKEAKKPEEDINNCAELVTGLTILDRIVTDLDLLALHNAFALEETMGAEALKKHNIEYYYILHPKEDTEYKAALAERQRREAEEEEERRKAWEEIERKEAEAKAREEAGAKAWAEELIEAQGWKMKKKTK